MFHHLSLPKMLVGSFLHQLQKLSDLLMSSAKTHIFVAEYHTLFAFSSVTIPPTHSAAHSRSSSRSNPFNK